MCSPDATLVLETHMIDEGFVLPDGAFHGLAEFHPDLPALSLVQYYPGDMLGRDPTSQWAPSRGALEGWLRGSGFEPTYVWQDAFRGGAVARRQELAVNGERAVDEAASWDMRTWTVDRSSGL
ncbi:MAG TPA: hypothetical protein VMI13_08890 [Solirubrobacteraceae bacterium]|nr:hypothetical protein [Solirubrobacteraceae bacterium]